MQELVQTYPTFDEANLEFFQTACHTKCSTSDFSKYTGTRKQITLVNASEIWMVDRLENADIEWQYEARQFDLGPHITKRRFMQPDLYLPELDLYIELTVGEPFIVNRKERRMFHLRKNNPGTRIILMQASDFFTLAYLPLSETLSYFIGRADEPVPTKVPKRTNYHDMKKQQAKINGGE